MANTYDSVRINRQIHWNNIDRETESERQLNGYKCKHTQKTVSFFESTMLAHLDFPGPFSIFGRVCRAIVFGVVSVPHYTLFGCRHFFFLLDWCCRCCRECFQCVLSIQFVNRHGPIVYGFGAHCRQLCVNRCVGNTKKSVAAAEYCVIRLVWLFYTCRAITELTLLLF